jgi:hypothetical protein
MPPSPLPPTQVTLLTLFGHCAAPARGARVAIEELELKETHIATACAAARAKIATYAKTLHHSEAKTTEIVPRSRFPPPEEKAATAQPSNTHHNSIIMRGKTIHHHENSDFLSKVWVFSRYLT